jgi:Helix-turn-helix domain
MAKGTFGERLKRERELREVSLEEVAKGTRIAERFLQALENERWDRLPAGVFGRGFVRSIARYLGLSEENLLAEYDLARGESANPPAPRPEERIPSPPKWMPAAVALAVAALVAALVFGGRYAWKAYQSHRAPKKSSAIVALPAPAETPSRAPSTARSLRSAAIPGVPLDLAMAARWANRLKLTADGRIAFKGDLLPGESRHGAAEERPHMTAAPPPALLLDLNGQELAPRVAPGSSGTIVWTRNDLRQATGGNTER